MLPHLPPEEIEWRVRCVVGVIVAMFGAATPRGIPGPFDTADTATLLDRLVTFAVAGLSAPSPSGPRGTDGTGQEVPTPTNPR